MKSVIETGWACGECGFTYAAYRGHLEPCPRCALARARATIQHLLDIVDLAAAMGLGEATIRRLRERLRAGLRDA